MPSLAGSLGSLALFAGQGPRFTASDALLQLLADFVLSAIVGPQFAER